MKKSDVKVGETYLMRHTSGLVKVRINQAITRASYGHAYGNDRDRHHWLATNEKTGRQIEIKSAVKLSPINPERDARVDAILRDREAARLVQSGQNPADWDK